MARDASFGDGGHFVSTCPVNGALPPKTRLPLLLPFVRSISNSNGADWYSMARTSRDLNRVENEPELLDVPQTLPSIGIRSGFKMWCANMWRIAPVPSPL